MLFPNSLRSVRNSNEVTNRLSHHLSLLLFLDEGNNGMTYQALLLITALTACAERAIAQAPAQKTADKPGAYQLIDMLTHSDRVALVVVYAGGHRHSR